jgi:hypothetical protein
MQRSGQRWYSTFGVPKCLQGSETTNTNPATYPATNTDGLQVHQQSVQSSDQRWHSTFGVSECLQGHTTTNTNPATYPATTNTDGLQVYQQSVQSSDQRWYSTFGVSECLQGSEAHPSTSHAQSPGPCSPCAFSWTPSYPTNAAANQVLPHCGEQHRSDLFMCRGCLREIHGTPDVPGSKYERGKVYVGPTDVWCGELSYAGRPHEPPLPRVKEALQRTSHRALL